MLDVLHGQQFKSGIPAGLPRDARVAHKTGEISTVAHDAGLVYLPTESRTCSRSSPSGIRRRRAARRRSPRRRTSRTPRSSEIATMTTDAASATFPASPRRRARSSGATATCSSPAGSCATTPDTRACCRATSTRSTRGSRRATRSLPNFSVWEFIHTDVREAPPLRVFPRYVPCATLLLALALELFREAVGTYVFIGANGGYRSPRHAERAVRRRTAGARPPTSIASATPIWTRRRRSSRTRRSRRDVIPTVWTRPFGDERRHDRRSSAPRPRLRGLVPREAPGETYNLKLAGDPL